MTSIQTADLYDDDNANVTSDEAEETTTDIITPSVSDDEAIELARILYGLTVLTIKHLNGYDDRNFHITVSPDQWDNDYITDICPLGYVLKIVNSHESKWPQAFGK